MQEINHEICICVSSDTTTYLHNKVCFLKDVFPKTLILNYISNFSISCHALNSFQIQTGTYVFFCLFVNHVYKLFFLHN